MGVQINGSTGNVIAIKGTFSGDVGIAGTLTYEDATNVDAVGLITARNGIEIGARPGVGASISRQGNAIFSGVTTSTTIHVGVDTGVYGEDLVVTGNTRVTGITTFGTSDNPAMMVNIGMSTLSSAPVLTVPDMIKHSGDPETRVRFDTGMVKVETTQIERLRIGPNGQIGINGANYGTDGQVLTSQGSSAAVQWSTASSPNIGATETQGYQNLKIRTTANNSTVITCDSVLLANTSGVLVKVDSVNVTLDATGTGLNGLDTGSLAAQKFYYIWIINNGSTTGAIASLSSTSPTLPSGYTYKARVGGVATNVNSGADLLLGQQINSSYHFALTASSKVRAIDGSGAVSSSQFAIRNVSALASNWTAFIKTSGGTNAGTTHRWQIGGTTGTNDGNYHQDWQMYHVTYNGIGDMNFNIPFIPVIEVSSGVPQAYLTTNSNTGPNWYLYCTSFRY